MIYDLRLAMSSMSLNDTFTALQEGEITLHGEFMWGSNYTYLVQLEHAGEIFTAVYKPTKGVRPLWDFPSSSLARREVAAYLISEALQWELVPPSAYRKDAPLGPGSIQLYIDHNPEYHYFNFSSEDRQRLRPIVVFDLLANNADRKGSHILVDVNRHMWLIDHGICFHADEKLRTVIWDFAGEAIPAQLLADIKRFREKQLPLDRQYPEFEGPDLARELVKYLTRDEIVALARRADHLLEHGCSPNPDLSRRQYPWPPV